MITRKIRSRSSAPFQGGSRRLSLSNAFHCSPLFIVAEHGMTVMFSRAFEWKPLLLIDGEVKEFPSEISTDEEQAGFVLSHTRVGRG